MTPLKLAIISDFIRPPWGGGNQFLLGLKHQLEKSGVIISSPMLLSGSRLLDFFIRKLNQFRGYNFVSRADAVLFNSFNFDPEKLQRQTRHQLPFIHRVDGPIDVYRGTTEGLDQKIWEINREFAAGTIFQSHYSLKKHQEMGLHFKNPIIISNAPDPRYFHRRGRINPPDGKRPVKIISTAWSTNPKKGFPIYRWLGSTLDQQRFSFTFIGRCPDGIPNCRILPPVAPKALGAILRQHDLYIAASQADPCSNSLLEALACGLPTLYLNSGGHPELVGRAGLPFSSADELPPLLEKIAKEFSHFQDSIQIPQLPFIAEKYLQFVRKFL